jgi:hypothetical protein
MKKTILISIFFSALLFFVFKTNYLLAQKMTVPDYSYGSVTAASGSTNEGVTDPGPYGKYTQATSESSYGVFFAHGYRYWGYPSAPLLICGDFPLFNVPGFHGVWNNTAMGCSNPSDSYMASVGSVVAEPASNQIWCLTNAMARNGPVAPYCVPNPFGSGQICYPAPSTWGEGISYGYLRKTVVVQSTGTLQTGDPVDINASLEVMGTYEGDGWDALSTGVLFLNKMSENFWLSGIVTREYLRWSDVEDILGTPYMLNAMLGYLAIDLNSTDDITATVAIGDTIIVEVAFNNTVKHTNPAGISAEEGWNGQKPEFLFTNIENTYTNNYRNLIKNNGNSLSYDLTSLTSGAVLEPVTPDGKNLDTDKDGISDVREKGADGNNSTYDGNADGIPDYQQSNVSSFLTFDGQNYVTLIVPSGTELSQIAVTDNPSPSDTPEDAEFPFGFFDFSIDGFTPGEAVSVTLILHDASTISKYYKYGLTPDILTPHWYEFTYDDQTGAEINGNVITLHFVDGLRGDEDITVNGSIKEPGGPVISGTTGLPSLNEISSGIIVYPNPATDYIRLQFNNIVPSNNYILRINSIAGKIMLEKLIDVKDPNQELVIPVDFLPGGIYLITLSVNKFNYKSKFIKLK